ncbi:TIGR02206 family membrane protein [Sneathia sanguinegens]|jgi:hypothetical protein|uniref:TMEM164-related integral membrane acyltransferase n=1 Tax=Sneathia sanguinegens TaxID=40543 RepID=UPI0008372D80|nr:TIGR02206 family membrane protein [Sneathia sanguinegens]MDU4652263.1 TIGR02206 family membrane protein [Sneathia sanguinegens]
MYSFKYFEPIHIHALVFWFIISLILIIIPVFKKNFEKGIYTTIIGYFFIFAKIFDIYYRIKFEHELWYTTFPLNLCNISLIFAGIYFITRKNILFNFVYFYFTGAILAILLPNINPYYTKAYVYVFIGTHILEIMSVIYAFYHLNARVTKKGLYTSLIGYLFFTFVAKVVNAHFGTNYMYVSDYIISAVNFIKPLSLYFVLFTILFMLSMIMTYLPFMYVDNDEPNEYSIK